MTEKKPEQEFYSRSAIAERLGVSLKELTQLMLDAGWIVQEDKKWKLTSKGEFEGGVYRQSKKYGEYIAWPPKVFTHPVIKELSQSFITVSHLSQQFTLPARLLNCLIADLGWIEHFAKGWQVTPLGKEQGGVQHQDDKSGVPFVMWPKTIVEAKAFEQSVSKLTDQKNTLSIDGHRYKQAEHCQIANWLYLLMQTYRFSQPVYHTNESYVTPDFYLPAHRIFIDYWSESLSPEQLSEQLDKREYYQKHKHSFIEVELENLAHLDNFLTKQLLQFGVSVY
jgi:hypothetical protein